MKETIVTGHVDIQMSGPQDHGSASAHVSRYGDNPINIHVSAGYDGRRAQLTDHEALMLAQALSIFAKPKKGETTNG